MGNPATNRRQELLPLGVGGKVLRAAVVASRKAYHTGKAGSRRSGPDDLHPSVELIPSLCPFCSRTLHGPTALRTISQHTVLQSRQDGTSQPSIPSQYGVPPPWHISSVLPSRPAICLSALTRIPGARPAGSHPVPAGGSWLGSTNRERGAEPQSR